MIFLIEDAENMLAFGKICAEIAVNSPVRSIYLFAPLGGGKTTWTRGFVSAIPGGENAEISSPSFTLYNAYNTTPPVIHADLYRLPQGSPMPEEMEEALDDGNALLVLEWPEYLSKQDYDPIRLEIHIAHDANAPCENEKILDKMDNLSKKSRFVTLKAFGKESQALIDCLEPKLAARFLHLPE